MTPRTDWKEEVPPNEGAQFEMLAKALADNQQRVAKGGKPLRAVHAKATVGARARVEIAGDLPAQARVGIFAAPGTYEAWVRFSNAAFAPTSDHKPDVRGVAIKILGVPGKKIIPGMEAATTQDFLMINTPRLPFRNADEFVFFTLGAANQATLVPRALLKFGVSRTFGILKAFLAAAKPIASVGGQRFWSAAPIQWGGLAAKVSLVPAAANGPGKFPASANYLAEDIVGKLKQGPVVFDLMAQFYSDAAKTPIEDTFVEWLESDAPFVRVARVTLEQQEIGEAQNKYVESLSFDPWHAPVEFKPLGQIMRARNVAYRHSTIARGAAKEPVGEKAVAA